MALMDVFTHFSIVRRERRGIRPEEIKQIAHRLKITGASWESGNVPQVLRHRCAYLNGCLF